MSSIAETVANAEKMAEHYEEAAKRLIAQYGTGVRPGWVSTDLAIAQERAASYRKLVSEIGEVADD